MPRHGITARFVMLMATAAVLPLVAYGVVSIGSLRVGIRASVLEGNRQIASRAASQIEQYLTNNVRILRSAAVDLQGTNLAAWQQERILRNYVLAFPEFRDLTLADERGRVVASSRIAPSAPTLPPPAVFDESGVAFAPIEIDDDLLPKTSVVVRIDGLPGQGGWLVGELRLEEMWRLVDRLRVGERGFALVVDEGGRLIAHGHPDEKPRVARGEQLDHHPLVGDRVASARHASSEYDDAGGRHVLGVAVPVPTLGWTLIVEQPTDEAYAITLRLERQLMVVIGLALLIVVGLGYYWGRSLIQPIFALMRGTEALAEGRMDARVRIERTDEFRKLGEAFNSMADRLVELQQEARRQERQVMFGRIAAGLVHDLSHPIQNIGNNCRLMFKLHDDEDVRQTFRRVVEREMSTLRRVLEDLRNLGRPIPLERFPIDVGRSLGEVVDSMRALSDTAGVTLDYEPPMAPLAIEGDMFALGRVYRNLILNAIQATAPGGRIVVRAGTAGGRVRIEVADTGCGIAQERLSAIFDDFATTKRRGLGLGLAIARKVVEQLDGTISVTSEVGRGTIFALEFAPTDARPIGTTPEPSLAEWRD